MDNEAKAVETVSMSFKKQAYSFEWGNGLELNGGNTLKKSKRYK